MQRALLESMGTRFAIDVVPHVQTLANLYTYRREVSDSEEDEEADQDSDEETTYEYEDEDGYSDDDDNDDEHGCDDSDSDHDVNSGNDDNRQECPILRIRSTAIGLS